MAIPSYDDYVKNPDSFKSDAEIPSYDDYISQQPKPSAARRYIGDPAVSALKGAVGLDEGIVGLADLATGGRAGKFVKDSGIDFQRAQQGLDELYSPEQRLANENVQQANGVLPTIGAIAKNPSVIPHQIIQSAPLMLGGQAIARGAMSLAPKLAPLAAGAIGEGVVTAGSNAEQVRQQSGNELISPMQSALAAGSGLVTGAITQGSGQLASKLGVGDVNTMLLGGNQQAATKGLARRIAESGGLEAGQEFLQSGQEQASTNLALNKPVGEGVGNAAALGAVTGFGMGIPAAIAQPSGPLSRASTSAPEVPVVEPTQPEATVEQPETAATTEPPVSNTVAPVEVNPAAVEPSNTVNSVNPNTVNTVNSTEPESTSDNQFDLVGEQSKAVSYANQIKDDRRLIDETTGKIYTANGYIWGKIKNANIPFDQALDEFNTEYARQSQSTPASPGADSQLTEPSTGEAGTEIPGTQEGSEVTQGATDQKLTGENDGQIAGTDQGVTNSSIGTTDATNINAGLPEIDGADNGAAIPPIVNADRRVDGDSDSSNGGGLSGDVRRGINGTGGISDSALGDNGAIDQNPVLRTGVKLPNELTSPVDTAQQPRQEIKDEKVKETPYAGQERLLNAGAPENGASVLNEDNTGTNDTQEAINPTPQTESIQSIAGTDTIGADTAGQKEEAKPVDESVKPYALSTGKNTFTSKAADTLLDNPKKPDVTRDSHDKVEVSKGVFQLIPKSANSKPIEIDGIKTQEQDETTTIPKQPITQEAKQPDEQVPIPANSDEVAAQSGETADGQEEVQGKIPSQDNETGRGDNVDVKASKSNHERDFFKAEFEHGEGIAKTFNKKSKIFDDKIKKLFDDSGLSHYMGFDRFDNSDGSLVVNDKPGFLTQDAIKEKHDIYDRISPKIKEIRRDYLDMITAKKSIENLAKETKDFYRPQNAVKNNKLSENPIIKANNYLIDKRNNEVSALLGKLSNIEASIKVKAKNRLNNGESKDAIANELNPIVESSRRHGKWIKENGFKKILNGQEVNVNNRHGKFKDVPKEIQAFIDTYVKETQQAETTPETETSAQESPLTKSFHRGSWEPDINVSLGYGGFPNGFEISTEGGNVTGYVRDSDFPGEVFKKSRGELFAIKVDDKVRKKGIGTQLFKDVARLMLANGVTTIKITQPNKQYGQPFVKTLIRDGLISEPLKTSESGTSEYKILYGLSDDQKAETPEQKVVVKSLEDFTNDSIDASGYRSSYESDANLMSQFKDDLKLKWKEKFEAATEKVDDKVIDEYVDNFGLASLQSRMRGVHEKAIEGWMPKDIREQKVNEFRKLSTYEKPIYERTWPEHRDEFKKAFKRKLSLEEFRAEKDHWLAQITNAKHKGKIIPNNVLKSVDAVKKNKPPEQEYAINENAEIEPVQPEPAADTSGTPAADVDSTDGQEVLGQETVTAIYDKLSAGDKKKLEGKSSYFWKGEKYKDVANKVISKDNLDVRLKKEPIYGNNKADGNIESYSYSLTDGRRTTKIPDFLGRYIEEIQKEIAKTIAQIPENQPEQELKQEDTVADKVTESDKKAVRTENKELIGKGSSGEVFKIGNEVEKKSTNDEAKVYGLLSGVEGIAKGYEVNGKIRTPYYKNIISVDTIKYDDRKGLAGLISKSVERINHAVSELTNTGYYYNDPLQFGMNEDHSLDLIDFSMATNKEGDRVLNDNLSLLASFYKQFGLTRQAEAVSQVKEVITNQHHHVKYGTNALLGDEFDGVNYKELTDRLDGKKANNAYYTTNARYVNIKDTAQTDNINGIKTILSVNKLSDKDIKGWELVPVHERANTEATVETDNTPLSIFTQMEEAKKLPRKEVLAAEKAAQERMDASPMADRLNYIHKNYYSLVQELIDRKDDPVKLTNCKTL